MHSSSPAYEDLDLDARVYLDEVICEFEAAFLADPTARLETFLASARGPRERAVLLLELLRVELECRGQLGHTPTAEEYLLRLPDDHLTVHAAFRAPVDRLTGSVLGKYHLTRIIGRGAMGVVYLATDVVVNRQVAVKLFLDASAAPQGHEYLRREAQVIGQLLHPNVVTLFEASEHNGAFFLVLEYVPGGSAASGLSRNGPFNWVVAGRILRDVCRGLAAAHAVGLVHRDIKPANILLVEPGGGSSSGSQGTMPLAKLTDFGLARATGDRACVGTPRYMAPEQVLHGTSDPTTDVYSLGATFFALLTGSAPFHASTLAELQEAHRTAPVPDVRVANPAIPEKCGRIIRRCLAKSPGGRYQAIEPLIADLDDLLAAEDAPRPPRRRYLQAAGLVALTAIVGGFVAQTRPPLPPPEAPARAQAPSGLRVPPCTNAGPWEPLFNGRDLTGWEVRSDKFGAKLTDEGGVCAAKEIGGERVLWLSGQKDLDLSTVRDYENYHLTLEYKWLPPFPAAPNSGILYHCCNFGNKPFQCNEFELWPPDSGRYGGLGHYPTRVDVCLIHQGQFIPGVHTRANVKLNHNWENERGHWNRVDLICVGDSIVHVLNARVVLTLVRSRYHVGDEEKPLTRGRIMLQSHRGGIAFRNIEIRSVDGIPSEFLSTKDD